MTTGGRIAYFLLGFIAAWLLLTTFPSIVCNHQPEIIFDTIESGGTVSAVPVDTNTTHVLYPIVGTGYSHSTGHVTRQGSGSSLSWGPAPVVDSFMLASQPGVKAELIRPSSGYSGHYDDSLVSIDVVANMDNDTCKVNNFEFHYAVKYPDLSSLIPLLPPSNQTQNSCVMIGAEPWTDFTRSGLFLSLLSVHQSSAVGVSLDPFTRTIKGSIYKTIWKGRK